MMKPNYLLLTGHRKSGTTMLHKLFDGHPLLNVYPVDLSLLYAYFPCKIDVNKKERVELVITKSTESIEGRKVTDSCSSFSASSLIERLWELTDPEALVNPASIISAVASAWCSYTDSDPSLPFVFKETSQSIHAHRLLSNQINLKVVQIIRDPRDNYAAIKAGVPKYYSKMGEDEKESLASVINRSRMDLLSGFDLNTNSDDWFHAIRFEDLAADPNTVMAGVASFCGIDFNNVLLEPTFLGMQYSGNNHEGERFRGISAKNVGRWKERISGFEAGVIEYWLRDAMSMWGYECELDRKEAINAFSEFYTWYNCRYFYHDSFSVPR